MHLWERINKYFYFILFMLSEAWVCLAFSFDDVWGKIESLISFLTFLGLLIYEEIKDLRKSEDSDIALFKDFLETLPFEGSISFIDCTDMSSSCVDPEKHNDLRNFLYHWDDASHEFIDNNIEKRRKVLWKLIEEYIIALGTHTVTTDDGHHTIPPEWKTEQPEYYNEVIDSFHNLAGQIVIAHQEMIRYAKNKLKI
ncbi:hypothetical protein ACFL50_04550 [Candidatus Latescibacterota bacterium]